MFGVRYKVATELNRSKHVVTTLLPSTRQQVWVSQIFGDDHYKMLVRVTIDLIQWPWVPNTCKKLRSSTGNGYVSMLMKNSQVGHLTTRKLKKSILEYEYSFSWCNLLFSSRFITSTDQLKAVFISRYISNTCMFSIIDTFLKTFLQQVLYKHIIKDVTNWFTLVHFKAALIC